MNKRKKLGGNNDPSRHLFLQQLTNNDKWSEYLGPQNDFEQTIQKWYPLV